MIQPDYVRIGFKGSRTAARVAAAGHRLSLDTILEKLESRRFFNGDTTVLTDIEGGTDSSAAYLLDLAVGEEPTAPEPAPTQLRPAPTFTFVAAAGGETETPAPPTNTGSTGSGSPTTTPARAATTTTTQTARPDSDFRYVLRPGPGFVGPTEQPTAVGDPTMPGHASKAIARWDVVPHQSFTDMFNVGVVAFHINEISKVEFSVNGGEWTAVRAMSQNKQTNVFEYTATLMAKDFQDGEIEVRAIAWPKTGVPRVLESLSLFANAGGTIGTAARFVSPTGNDANDGLTAQTPKKDPALAIRSMAGVDGVPAGATLHLLPGEHTWKHPAFPGNTTVQQAGTWLTIQAAPGYGREDVSIRTDVATDGQPYMMTLNRVRWHEVTFRSGQIPYMPATGSKVWYDGVTVDGTSRFNWTTGFSYGEAPAGRFLTNSTVTNLNTGAEDFTLIRNSAISNTLAGGPWNTPFVINTTITNVDPGPTGAHPDVWRSRGTMENVIIYGLKTPEWSQQASSAGLVLFSRAGDGQPLYQYNGVAIVDVDVSAGGGVGVAFAMGGVLRHVYMKDTTIRGAAGPDLTPGNYQGDETVLFENVSWLVYNTGLPWTGPVFPNARYR